MELIALAIVALDVSVLLLFARESEWAQTHTKPLLGVVVLAPLAYITVSLPVETLAVEQTSYFFGLVILSFGANAMLYLFLKHGSEALTEFDDLGATPRIHNKRP